MVATDLDGTLIDGGYRLSPKAQEAAELLQAWGAVLVLVTSKTLDEALLYAERLGLDPACPGYAVVAEEGALAWASSPRLLPEERIEAPSLEPQEALELAPPGCRERMKPIQWMSPQEFSRLTGLPPGEAAAATRRLLTTGLHGPRGCLEETMRRALRLGLYARLGRTFLMLGRHGGKAWGLRRLLARSPALRAAPLVALGDDPMDEELLAQADVAVVVPGPLGPRCSPPGLRYTVAPAPPPEAWPEAIRGLLLRLLTGLHGRGPGPLRAGTRHQRERR